MNKNDIRVDFDNSILALSNSLLHHYGVASEYKSLPILDAELAKDYQNLVLLILDCLGKNILEKHLSEDAFLRRHKVADIFSIFPPTTAAATIAYHSGLPPIASGWLGWMNYFSQYDRPYYREFSQRRFLYGRAADNTASGRSNTKICKHL